jgi:MFS family permease
LSSGFQKVGFIAVLTHLAFFATVPLLPLFLVENLGAAEGFIAIFALCELAGGAIVSFIMPRLSKAIGNRWMIGVAMIGTSMAAILVALSPNLYWTLIPAFISGASWTLVGNGLFGYFSDNSPQEGATRYSTAYTQTIFLAMFIAPHIGSILEGSGIGLFAVLMAGGILRFTAGFLTITEPSRLFIRSPHSMGSQPVTEYGD